ncbi:hypothetical protein EDB92DRAFT_1796845, partial [Lactarius akahatsu]
LAFTLRFLLSPNLCIAPERAWDQAIASRGRVQHSGTLRLFRISGEWYVSPVASGQDWRWRGATLYWCNGYIFTRRVIQIPMHVLPVGGLFVTAVFKALDTARYLHMPYFQANNMTKKQIAVFVAEHKWDYRLFGFAAALLETLPFVGLIFSVSNRIGAAMWAHDHEKRQHWFSEKKRKNS